MRRFQVAEESMSPALRAGDILFASPDADPTPGKVVVFPHGDRWLVKRIAAVADGEAWVESDNPEATMADSRTLGWIPTHRMFRVFLRYRAPLSFRLNP